MHELCSYDSLVGSLMYAMMYNKSDFDKDFSFFSTLIKMLVR